MRPQGSDRIRDRRPHLTEEVMGMPDKHPDKTRRQKEVKS
jgi:hypothetical protein